MKKRYVLKSIKKPLWIFFPSGSKLRLNRDRINDGKEMIALDYFNFLQGDKGWMDELLNPSVYKIQCSTKSKNNRCKEEGVYRIGDSNNHLCRDCRDSYLRAIMFLPKIKINPLFIPAIYTELS